MWSFSSLNNLVCPPNIILNFKKFYLKPKCLTSVFIALINRGHWYTGPMHINYHSYMDIPSLVIWFSMFYFLCECQMLSFPPALVCPGFLDCTWANQESSVGCVVVQFNIFVTILWEYYLPQNNVLLPIHIIVLLSVTLLQQPFTL